MHGVQLNGVGSVKSGANESINITLQVVVKGHGGNTTTAGMFWRVSAWASADANGGGKKVGFVKQVRSTRYLVNLSNNFEITFYKSAYLCL